MTTEPIDVTNLLGRLRQGDGEAMAKIIPAVYGELHRIAGALMSREAREHTLQTTALINEAFLRLMQDKSKDWKDRAHFVAVAARAMRQVLVDYARRNLRAKRGGAAVRVELSEAMATQTMRLDEMLDWDALLTQLEEMDPRSARMVELRWFTGLEVAEIAEVLGVSEKTVKRDWAVTRAWLKARIHERRGSGPTTEGGIGDDSAGMGTAEGPVPPDR